MAVEHRAKLKTNHSHNMAADQTLKFYIINKSNLFPQDDSRTACHNLKKWNYIPAGQL